jgi:hypothetical protein
MMIERRCIPGGSPALPRFGMMFAYGDMHPRNSILCNPLTTGIREAIAT